VCPYHAWTYDLRGELIAARGFRDDERFAADEHGLVELPVQVWQGWLFGHALHAIDSDQVPSFTDHLGELAGVLAPYACDGLVLADRHTYEVAANWKVIAENYHECYHCPLIHPELCQITPPDSGDNYHLPGSWIGGSMVLRDGMATMSLTGELAATPLPGADPRRVEYVHILPNLLVSAHPDYVMAHRLVPLAPGRTWVECSWLVAPGPDGQESPVSRARGAVDFWDVTNKQDWAACESVQRGLASPHFRPGPFAPNEDAVVDLVATISRAYQRGRFEP
jgi:Rieske 2Fe-2S family protein